MLSLPIFNVRIQPCSVGEQHLTPQAQGHYCALCDRLVQDFTNSTQTELEQARATSPDGRVCSQFLLAQLVPAVRLRPKLRRFLVALVLVCGLGLTRQEALGQEIVVISCPDGPKIEVSINPLFISASPVDVLPQYPKVAWSDIPLWLSKQARYYNLKDSGTLKPVVMEFIIDQAGHVVKPNVTGYPGVVLYAESLRLVNSLGKFKPGRIGNQPVDTKVNLILQFKVPPLTQQTN
ncbi:protein TonB [Hymenobacter roseosalivarius DSM 11622]|uniref:Protein TonB n=1 Tax=Hymenobacter roseosalivarius DSM 11622 TaxID=645990 RepID=A0A1W1VLL7_9BACT|nr:hypothetical protein [Hymenobacter roseosalivarius]SMB94262.1 protein TonB [Hymenobacter roseosalivarius DSM 11622]